MTVRPVLREVTPQFLAPCGILSSTGLLLPIMLRRFGSRTPFNPRAPSRSFLNIRIGFVAIAAALPAGAGPSWHWSLCDGWESAYSSRGGPNTAIASRGRSAALPSGPCRVRSCAESSLAGRRVAETSTGGSVTEAGAGRSVWGVGVHGG